MSQTVFLTGATGLVGSFICRELLAKGYLVNALKREHSDTSLLNDCKDSINWVDGDILDILSLEKAIENIDFVVHSAAIISFHRHNRDLMYKTNVEGSANILNAAREAGVKRFIHISSVAALGRNPKKLEISEESKWEESKHNSHYSKSKYLAELEVQKANEEGLPTLIFNPSIVLGPGNWKEGSTKIFKYVFDKNLFYPKGEVNFVDVRDVAEMVVGCLKNPQARGRYTLNGGSISYRQFLNEISTRFKVKAPRFKSNKILMLLALLVSEVIYFATRKPSLITRETVRSSNLSYKFKNDKIIALTGTDFRNLKETVEFTCNQLLDRYVHNPSKNNVGY